jgi:hypothetical protein
MRKVNIIDISNVLQLILLSLSYVFDVNDTYPCVYISMMCLTEEIKFLSRIDCYLFRNWSFGTLIAKRTSVVLS